MLCSRFSSAVFFSVMFRPIQSSFDLVQLTFVMSLELSLGRIRLRFRMTRSICLKSFRRVPCRPVLSFGCANRDQIDASAARTCFQPLQRVTEAHGVCIAYAGITDRMEMLLR